MQNLSLFDEAPAAAVESLPETSDQTRQRELGQYMTPMWVAEALIKRHYPELDSNDCVFEMTCGTGAFLAAIPEHVPALGVEIDPVLADIARRNTGRRVITGDFRQVKFDLRPTAIVGNPPFTMDLVTDLLDSAQRMLPENGRVGLILPASALQTPSRVCRYSDDWSLQAEMLPRTIFRGLQYPLSFVLFTKDRRRAMVGMALYQETNEIAAMPERVRDLLNLHPKTWIEVVRDALDRMGGRGSLQDIYSAVEPNRPTGNPAWKEKVRQVLRAHFTPVARAEYALAA